ncbi:malate dehydrogenase (quinone) [Corynebacterium sp. 153RC1]|uniref:malate dehydrogenase (quinone) n=1 Tax=unclassified Corynebacterium TaxID=2624378 RepID=UPI00211C4302|nr:MULTISPECIES: malate dehydrogenase (quinone) [unclassified Corynebacterium]MCQ9371000.1 malate dehydrogenase (quinone) [Corynebacterium sp. 35RC1]MCQ9351615.1 malate dehydrogenase (quinone) [Corynebacterium sp. 209RC1]MCQ9353984.1 malate dehydrogenase (quinone) [Corynebacterium sp. 1222RC1]MCQ9355898.1 malate dehydrogenase (quinone) [Corynebacterium sp. 122RC1]MCQ9358142.1 malate dehydrogenase (quinone) [Corynebacterium sp. 142RC1]
MSDSKKPQHVIDEVDVALIGAGIMSATLGAMLRTLEPNWSQIVFERLDAPAEESSSPWNNAGTGHSALCELNYTPEVNGKIDIAKAVGVNEKFQMSRQFWSYQVNQGVLPNPREWINPVPHVSFGRGEQQVAYIKKRFEALENHPLFPNMQYTDDREEFTKLLPLMGEGRSPHEPVAASWTDAGTDINYGAQTKQFLAAAEREGTEIRYGHEVKNLQRDGARWKITVKNVHTGDTQVVRAKFVFVGAGGMALPLLQKSGIPEIRGWGGFPVSGMWLRCTNEEIIERHAAKVYGQASVDAPPMSVPHLDTRVIDGKKGLLFGPYAGWTPKFLKTGTYFDLFKSIRPSNLLSYVGVGVQEMGLTKYLITEVVKDQAARMETLREYMPNAKDEDWELVVAGQRVQAIQPVAGPSFSTLAFGTSLINSADGTIAGLLGASPGASIAPAAMVELLERCFGDHMVVWGDKIKEMVPSYGIKLATNKKLFEEMWEYTQKTLELEK